MKTRLRARRLVVLLVGALVAVTAALHQSDTSPPQAALAQGDTTWTVSVIIHELHDLDRNDASGAYDFYHHIVFSSAPLRACDNEEEFIEGYDIYPDWTCSHTLSPDDPSEVVSIWIFDDDWPSEDDLIDVHSQRGDENTDRIISFEFSPATQRLNIFGVDDDEDESVDEEGEFACARGRIEMAGVGDDDRARIVFSVSGTQEEGANDGDSDGDGLTDADEICGIGNYADGSPDVDLPAMGADPFRKDLFVELDWMVDDDGGADDHSHEPWLPALMNAWHEFDEAGIALHVDTGTLYANYSVDFDQDGHDEISVDASGNVDLNGDGIVDIGNLGALGVREGGGTPGGGNRICADLSPAPCGAGQLGEFAALSADDADLVKAGNFVENRAPAFRYGVFGHLSDEGNAGGWTPWGGLDFLISLGGFYNQAFGLVGPAGLPVRGEIGDHTGVFLHELGHSLGLCHGGGRPADVASCQSDPDAWFNVGGKPNYVSVMNYTYTRRGVSYDLDGVGVAPNLLGIDFDHDGLDDGQRYTYSWDLPDAVYPNPADPDHAVQGGLPPLEETDLNEPAGGGDTQAFLFYGPELDLDGNGSCDICLRSAAGNQAIDWSRGDHDGDGTRNNDMHVDSLTADPSADPPVPADIPADINDDGLGALGQLLIGFNDYNYLRNQSLKALSREEDEAFVRSLIRVTGLTEAQAMDLCDAESTRILAFEDLQPGDGVTGQYAAQGVYFLADGLRQPTVAGPPQRFGLPTSSPPFSLVNSPAPPATSAGTPLVITFDPPVRIVSLRLGRVTEGDPATDLAVLTAYDADGFPMGSVQRSIPDYHQGITAHLAMGAIFPKLLISRVELNYVLLTANPLEPEHIDDFVFCRDVVARDPHFPDSPSFGELTVGVGVTAEVRRPVATGDELEPRGWEGATLSDIPIQWERPDAAEAGSEDTAFSLTLDEGEHLKLTAPAVDFHPQWGPLTLLYWREGENIYFPREETAMATRMLHNTSFTAVYRAGPYRTYLALIQKEWQPGAPTQTLVLTPVADAYISSAAPGTNYGTASTLYVGRTSASLGRSLFQFDLSGIPAGSTVISATFQAYLLAFSSAPSSLDVEVRRPNDPWTEAGVTWNGQPNTTGIGKVNGVGTAMSYYDWDVAGLVQDWIDGVANHGLALWSYSEGTLGWRGFASRESASPPSPPRLTITYRP